MKNTKLRKVLPVVSPMFLSAAFTMALISTPMASYAGSLKKAKPVVQQESTFEIAALEEVTTPEVEAIIAETIQPEAAAEAKKEEKKDDNLNDVVDSSLASVLNANPVQPEVVEQQVAEEQVLEQAQIPTELVQEEVQQESAVAAVQTEETVDADTQRDLAAAQSDAQAEENAAQNQVETASQPEYTAEQVNAALDQSDAQAEENAAQNQVETSTQTEYTAEQMNAALEQSDAQAEENAAQTETVAQPEYTAEQMNAALEQSDAQAIENNAQETEVAQVTEVQTEEAPVEGTLSLEQTLVDAAGGEVVQTETETQVQAQDSEEVASEEVTTEEVTTEEVTTEAVTTEAVAVAETEVASENATETATETEAANSSQEEVVAEASSEESEEVEEVKFGSAELESYICKQRDEISALQDQIASLTKSTTSSIDQTMQMMQMFMMMQMMQNQNLQPRIDTTPLLTDRPAYNSRPDGFKMLGLADLFNAQSLGQRLIINNGNYYEGAYSPLGNNRQIQNPELSAPFSFNFGQEGILSGERSFSQLNGQNSQEFMKHIQPAPMSPAQQQMAQVNANFANQNAQVQAAVMPQQIAPVKMPMQASDSVNMKAAAPLRQAASTQAQAPQASKQRALVK